MLKLASFDYLSDGREIAERTMVPRREDWGCEMWNVSARVTHSLWGDCLARSDLRHSPAQSWIISVPIMIKHACKWTDTGEVLRSAEFTDLLRKFHVPRKKDSVAVRAHKYFIRNGRFYERIFVHVTTVSFVAERRWIRWCWANVCVKGTKRLGRGQIMTPGGPGNPGKFRPFPENFSARFSNYNPKRTERWTSACIWTHACRSWGRFVRSQKSLT